MCVCQVSVLTSRRRSLPRAHSGCLGCLQIHDYSACVCALLLFGLRCVLLFLFIYFILHTRRRRILTRAHSGAAWLLAQSNECELRKWRRRGRHTVCVCVTTTIMEKKNLKLKCAHTRARQTRALLGRRWQRLSVWCEQVQMKIQYTEGHV